MRLFDWMTFEVEEFWGTHAMKRRAIASAGRWLISRDCRLRVLGVPEWHLDSTVDLTKALETNPSIERLNVGVCHQAFVDGLTIALRSNSILKKLGFCYTHSLNLKEFAKVAILSVHPSLVRLRLSLPETFSRVDRSTLYPIDRAVSGAKWLPNVKRDEDLFRWVVDLTAT
jgi:hypothetical protein